MWPIILSFGASSTVRQAFLSLAAPHRVRVLYAYDGVQLIGVVSSDRRRAASARHQWRTPGRRLGGRGGASDLSRGGRRHRSRSSASTPVGHSRSVARACANAEAAGGAVTGRLQRPQQDHAPRLSDSDTRRSKWRSPAPRGRADGVDERVQPARPAVGNTNSTSDPGVEQRDQHVVLVRIGRPRCARRRWSPRCACRRRGVLAPTPPASSRGRAGRTRARPCRLAPRPGEYPAAQHRCACGPRSSA